MVPLFRPQQLVRFVLSLFLLNAVTTTPVQAGIIPWTYNAIFGYGPIFGGGYHGGYGGMGYGAAPYMGMPYAAPMDAYPATSMPSVSYYPPLGAYPMLSGSPGLSLGGCGCDPCANPCGSCFSSGCSPCGTGGCASGNCGTSYTPATTTPPSASPPEPRQSEPAAPVPTYRNEPPLDDFKPVPPRESDTSRSAPMSPDLGIPSTIPKSVPGKSTIPESTLPLKPKDDYVLPNTTNRNTAPGEPSGNKPAAVPTEEVNPLDFSRPGTLLTPQPADVDSSPVASVKAERRRVVVQAGYRIPSVVRVRIAPLENVETTDTQLVQK